MLLGIYDVFYSQCSHQHVSVGILAILKLLLLYKNTKIQAWLPVSPPLHNN